MVVSVEEREKKRKEVIRKNSLRALKWERVKILA